jgi:hypothetical protein
MAGWSRVRYLWTTGLLSVLPAVLPAQTPPQFPVPTPPRPTTGTTTVSGMVFDSLSRTMLRGAQVQLVRSGSTNEARTAVADSNGRFFFTGVPSGSYLIGFMHPKLDSLGFDPIVRPMTVTASPMGVRVPLAVPSGSTLAQQFCGDGADSLGVLIGRVGDADRDAAIGGAVVKTVWAETRVAATGIGKVQRSARATSDAEGKFVLCGLPMQTALDLTAEVAAAGTARDTTARKTFASNLVEITFPAGVPLQYRDLLISRIAPAVARAGAPRTGTGRVVGRVVLPNGRPVAQARITFRDGRVADSLAISDSSGVFRFSNLPAGMFMLDAVKIGMAPGSSSVSVRAGGVGSATITMTERVVTLETQKVTSTASTDRTGFEDRRKRGFGTFISGDELMKRTNRVISDALISVPGLRIGGTDNTGRNVLAGRGGCVPDVWLNGMRAPEGMRNIDDSVPPGQIKGIEVYGPGEAPGQFSGGNCTTVLIWMK